MAKPNVSGRKSTVRPIRTHNPTPEAIAAGIIADARLEIIDAFDQYEASGLDSLDLRGRVLTTMDVAIHRQLGRGTEILKIRGHINEVTQAFENLEMLANAIRQGADQAQAASAIDFVIAQSLRTLHRMEALTHGD